jgi:hypothetical protein
MEQLAKEMLRFVSYRAASSSSGSKCEFTNKISTDKLLQTRIPLEWATDEDLDQGIIRAMEDTVLANGTLANQVCFCSQFYYHSHKNRRVRMEASNELKMANKTTGLKPEHKYLVWFVNLTPTPTKIDDASSGSHWCVLLVDFTRGNGILGHGQSLRVSEVHNTPSTSPDVLNVFARVRFFDPMGGSMPSTVRDSLDKLLRDQLVGNLMRMNSNYASKLTDQTRMNLELFWYNLGDHGSDSGVASGWSLQTGDGVQCGIWCIWFVHQFMLHGILQLRLWALPPSPTNQVANQLSFRRWYFVKSTAPEKQPTREEGDRRKRVRPSAEGASSRQAIELHSSDDDGEVHAADHAIELHSSDGEVHPAAAASAADHAIDLQSSEDDEVAPKKKMRPMRHAPTAVASAPDHTQVDGPSYDDSKPRRSKKRHFFDYH